MTAAEGNYLPGRGRPRDRLQAPIEDQKKRSTA
jgi:hypothetical protein